MVGGDGKTESFKMAEKRASWLKKKEEKEEEEADCWLGIAVVLLQLLKKKGRDDGRKQERERE
jgi:hypothetical protein